MALALPESLAERLAVNLQEQRGELLRELQQAEAMLMALGQLQAVEEAPPPPPAPEVE